MATKEQLKSYFASGQTITEAHMNALIDACFNNGDNNIEIEIVQDIPTTLLPRQKVWCVATQSEWIGADPANGIFPTLASGTPWPVRGYKLTDFSFYYQSDTGVVVNIFCNENVPFTLVRNATGLYSISEPQFARINNAIASITNSSVEEMHLNFISSENGGFMVNGITITRYDLHTFGSIDADSSHPSIVQIKVYPPLS